MLRRCLAALAVLVSILRSEPVLAQGIMLEGSIDCGLWMQARTESRAEALEHYLIGFPNGLLNWRTGVLLPPTPALFSQNACGFEFDPGAPRPERFLL